MGLLQVDVNYLAVFVASLVGMVIGALWYSPLLFGRLWMQISGMSHQALEQAKKKNMTVVYVLQFVALLVMAYVLAHLLGFMGVAALPEVFQLVFWLWLGFQATLELGTVLWADKSWSLFLLNASHNLVVLSVMGWILFLMA